MREEREKDKNGRIDWKKSKKEIEEDRKTKKYAQERTKHTFCEWMIRMEFFSWICNREEWEKEKESIEKHSFRNQLIGNLCIQTRNTHTHNNNKMVHFQWHHSKICRLYSSFYWNNVTDIFAMKSNHTIILAFSHWKSEEQPLDWMKNALLDIVMISVPEKCTKPAQIVNCHIQTANDSPNDESIWTKHYF